MKQWGWNQHIAYLYIYYSIYIYVSWGIVSARCNYDKNAIK